ncbi:MAG: hypothetical protein K0T99_01485 [Alphaproteobacteria bacterium]|nr:hypothetical protein [Alphaproteobacteria bacterium]
MVTLKSYAKLNLFLHVTGKTDDGYHNLDSMAVFAEDLYDTITIKESTENITEVTGNWTENLVGTNIVEKVLESFSFITSIPKFHIKIYKNIPIGSGLGGGSSNAAAVIRFLVKNFKPKISEDNLINCCKNIGADVTPCYYSKRLYFNGIGEKISLIKELPELYGVILYPSLSITTKDIFMKGFRNFEENIEHVYNFQNHKHLWEYLSLTRNSLFQNIGSHKTILTKIIHEIKSLRNCNVARMTGSGSACFRLFENKESASSGAKTLQKQFPEYSIYVTKLI